MTGARSKFYQPTRSGKALPLPHFIRYVAEATVEDEKNQVHNLVYSDDNKIGIVPEFDPIPGQGTPLSIFLQGAQLDSKGEPIGSTLTRWVTDCGSLNDPKNWAGGRTTANPKAVRWILIFDRSAKIDVGSEKRAVKNIQVDKITIFANG